MLSSAENWGPAPRALQVAEGKTLASAAYKRLREDIIQGKFAPREKLRPDLLKDRYEIGLSPLREALSRLARDGLVVAEGQRGFFVAPASLGELLDITELRTQFSVMALERSIRHGGNDWENRVVTSYYQLSKIEKQMAADPIGLSDEWEIRNRDFHCQLESGCGSPWLLHFCEVLYDQLERYRRVFAAYTEHGLEVHDDHRKIMEAALARQAEVACPLLAEHFTHAQKAVLERMRKQPGQGSAVSEARLDREIEIPRSSPRKRGPRNTQQSV